MELTLRLGFPANNKHDYVNEDDHNDEYYMKKIQELFNEKKKMFADQKLSKQPNNNQKTMTGNKRPRTLLTEEINVNGTKKNSMIRRKKIKKMVVRTPVVSNHVTEELKEFITREMNGSDIKLVIQKSLFTADLKKDQNRLSMPMKQVETHDFLTTDEKTNLENRGEIAVQLLGPRMQMHKDPMLLKIWHLKSTDNYVLKNKWNDFVKENKKDLKEETKIQVWSFRMDHKLCFAIACVDRPPHEQNRNDAA